VKGILRLAKMKRLNTILLVRFQGIVRRGGGLTVSRLLSVSCHRGHVTAATEVTDQSTIVGNG
jgi:hypothetical protein